MNTLHPVFKKIFDDLNKINKISSEAYITLSKNKKKFIIQNIQEDRK